MTDAAKTKAFVGKEFDRNVIPVLEEYIRIPNQSPHYEPDWQASGHTDKALQLLVNWITSQSVKGLTQEVIREGKRTPLIFITVPATNGNDQDSVLLYGHMDKQPPLDLNDWRKGLGPYTPVIEDGKLYGRGGADDGYSTFSAVLAIKNLQEQGISHPRTHIIIEASEESGSPDLTHYMTALAPRLGNVLLIVCLDSGCGNYEQFWLTNSLRGIAAGLLRVKILREGMHSGSASGIVPSSFRIVRQLLNRIEDVDTGKVKVAEAWVNVSDKVKDQAKQAAAVLGNKIQNEFPFVSGAHAISNDNTELLLNKTWAPQLSTIGSSGFPEPAKAGNVLRTESAFKLSMRLPPTCDGDKATAALKAVLEKDPPYGANVTFEAEDAAPGWAAPEMSAWLEKSVQDASHVFFNKPCLSVGEGGSIPFMGMLGRAFPKAQFVITGVLGPGSNAHGPNEFLHIEMAKNVTSCVSHVVHDFNNQIKKK